MFWSLGTMALALFANEARFFSIRVFFGACSLQKEVSNPPFFFLFGKSRYVNLRISARVAYFKFRRRHGALIRGGRLFEGGRLFNFSQIVA